jgi:hypothetical protein
MIRPEDEIQFTFGGIIFRKDVSGGVMSTEITFSPFELPDGVAVAVRFTDDDGKGEEVRRFYVTGHGRDSMASIHSAVIASTANKSSFQAVMEGDNGSSAELRIFILAGGITMVSPQTDKAVARLSFPTRTGLTPDDFDSETWGFAEVAGSTDDGYQSSSVQTFQDAVEFFAGHGIGIKMGEPMLPLAAKTVIPTR